MTLLSADQSQVDRAAVAVPSVIDALVATIHLARLEQLERTVAGADEAWVNREGDEGAFLVAARVRRELAELPRYGGYGWIQLVDRAAVVLRRFARRPFGPWVWIELLGVLPSHHRTVVENLALVGAGFTHYAPAARHAIANKVPCRGLLFDKLRRDRKLAVDELVAGLGDPPLRPVCEELLQDRVVDVAEELRARIPAATKGERETIVRLLRTIDARVDQSGQPSTTNLAELESRLRADPLDRETAQVWADHLQDLGDPRGALLSLDLAIAAADRPRQVELSADRAAMFQRDRKALVGKPGGFPFRDKYLGRGMLGFGSSWRAMLRGKPDTVRDKVMAFLAKCTDASPVVDDEDIHATFKLVWPGTAVVVPYQEPGHYGEGSGPSTLHVKLGSGKLELVLRFPFERFEDAGFVEVYEAVAGTLGKIALTPTGFSVLTPTVDGKKLKSKGQRYAGPAAVKKKRR